MTQIFGGTWTYLAHESEIPNDNDFITRRMGLRPLIIVRDGDGKIRALYNRCTHRGTTLCRWDKGNTKSFQCPYHGWNFLNTGKLRGVPWPDGYAEDMRDPKYNLAQVPRVESYRGFIFGTLSLDALPLREHLGPIAKIIDEWLDRNPGGKVVVCEANRFRFKGNWKLAYDNSCDGYHVAYSHRSLLGDREPFRRRERQGHGLLPQLARHAADVHALYRPRQPLQGQAAESGKAPGRAVGAGERASRHGALRGRIPAAATATAPSPLLDLAGSEPVNINVFPNFSLLGNHIQVFEPVGVGETNAIWYGTMVVNDGSLPADAVDRHQRAAHAHAGGVPEFRRGRRHRQFRADPARIDGRRGRMGLHAPRAWAFPAASNRIPTARITAPATDEAFMREHFKEWKRLMKSPQNLAITREP